MGWDRGQLLMKLTTRGLSSSQNEAKVLKVLSKIQGVALADSEMRTELQDGPILK